LIWYIAMFLLHSSLMTAFTVFDSMEHGARQNGGTGRLAWLKKLPEASQRSPGVHWPD
jgi:hypothetical protein